MSYVHLSGEIVVKTGAGAPHNPNRTTIIKLNQGTFSLRSVAKSLFKQIVKAGK